MYTQMGTPLYKWILPIQMGTPYTNGYTLYPNGYTIPKWVHQTINLK
jgi:hypothetical protein